MKISQILTFSFFAVLSALSPLQADLNDIKDEFVRMAVKCRGDFSQIEKNERNIAIRYCNASIETLENDWKGKAENWENLAQGLERYSPNAQIMRASQDLPKLLRRLEPSYQTQVTMWSDRLKFLMTETTKTELAHLPFTIETDGEILRTPSLKDELSHLKKDLTTLINFMSDLTEISNCTMSTKLEEQNNVDSTIGAYRQYIKDLKGHTIQEADSKFISNAELLRLKIECIKTFNGYIIGFFEKHSAQVPDLAGVFEALKTRYLNLFSILKYLSPTIDENYYLDIFIQPSNFSFSSTSSTILSRYEENNKKHTHQVEAINSLIQAHRLIEASRRSSLIRSASLPEGSETLTRRMGELLKRNSGMGTPTKASGSQE